MAARFALPLLLAAFTLASQSRPQEQCLDKFTRGIPGFTLNLEDSVQNGATYLLSNASLRNGWDCLRECCKTPGCNLALVQQDNFSPEAHDDVIKACFLINCLYEQEFVCKFAKKWGFLNYVEKDAYGSYAAQRAHIAESEDHITWARAGMDMKVQPMEPVTLNEIEIWDKEGIESYAWEQVSGDTSVEMVLQEPYFLQLSNLQVGQYVVALTVTGTAGKSSMDRVTITVLSEEQTIEHCHAEVLVGRCRGSFPRWYYNPATEECEEFIYGGCRGNKNNYLRVGQCQRACKNVPGPSHPASRRLNPVCGGHCLNTQFQCQDGCCIDNNLECDGMQDCTDGSDELSCDQYEEGFRKLITLDIETDKVRCVDAPLPGPCRGSFTHWYYDPYKLKCFSFTYGGCRGNDNNFLDNEECLATCDGVTENDIFGSRIGNHGSYEGDGSGSVQVAVAMFLATCIAVQAILGYCFLKERKSSSRRHQPVANGSSISTTEDTDHLVNNSSVLHKRK